jgi:hypothetical protein
MSMAIFLTARQIHGEMIQATGAIDEDKNSDLALPEVIRPQAVCVLTAENSGINKGQLITAVADRSRQTFAKRLQKQKDLGDLAPQPAFIATHPLENAIVDTDQPQKRIR